MRLEYGLMRSLIENFLQITAGILLNKGSMVLIFTALHLATTDLGSYVRDMVSATRRLSGIVAGYPGQPAASNSSG